MAASSCGLPSAGRYSVEYAPGGRARMASMAASSCVLLAASSLLPEALPELRSLATALAFVAGSLAGLLLFFADEAVAEDAALLGEDEALVESRSGAKGSGALAVDEGAASPMRPRSNSARRQWDSVPARRWADTLCTSGDATARTECALRALESIGFHARDDAGGWRRVVRRGAVAVSQRRNDFKGGPTMWRLQLRGLFASPEAVARLLQDEKRHPEWNPTLVGYDVLEEDGAGSEFPDFFGRSTRVTRTTAAGECGGLVSSRDFTNLLRTEKRGDRFIVGGTGLLDEQAHPPVQGAIRGRNGACGWVIAPGADAGTADVTWIIASDLRGWLSRALIDSAISTVMLKFASALSAKFPRP